MGSTPKDPDEKVHRRYRNADTIVWIDGREKLEGYDWVKRVKELRKRSGGRCEGIIPYSSLRCWHKATEPHHKVKRSVLRDDRLENLEHLCHDCHALRDSRKVRSDKGERREQT